MPPKDRRPVYFTSHVILCMEKSLQTSTATWTVRLSVWQRKGQCEIYISSADYNWISSDGSIPNVPLKVILAPQVTHSGIAATPGLDTLAAGVVVSPSSWPIVPRTGWSYLLERFSPRSNWHHRSSTRTHQNQARPKSTTSLTLMRPPLRMYVWEMLHQMSYVFAKGDQDLGVRAKLSTKSDFWMTPLSENRTEKYHKGSLRNLGQR